CKPSKCLVQQAGPDMISSGFESDVLLGLLAVGQEGPESPAGQDKYRLNRYYPARRRFWEGGGGNRLDREIGTTGHQEIGKRFRMSRCPDPFAPFASFAVKYLIMC